MCTCVRMTEDDRSTGRRYDPVRKSRIIDAAMTVIAEYGIARTTHRLIAAAADVPLGSLTYHFASLQDLCRQAFEREAEQMSATYAAHFEEVSSIDGLLEALVDLIHGGGDHDDWAISYELYLAALRDPELRHVTEAWMQASRRVLEQHLDPPTARMVDGLIEGLTMHRVLSTAPTTRAETRALLERALAGTRLNEKTAIT